MSKKKHGKKKPAKAARGEDEGNDEGNFLASSGNKQKRFLPFREREEERRRQNKEKQRLRQKCYLCNKVGHTRQECPGLDDGGRNQSRYKGKMSKIQKRRSEIPDSVPSSVVATASASWPESLFEEVSDDLPWVDTCCGASWLVSSPSSIVGQPETVLKAVNPVGGPPTHRCIALVVPFSLFNTEIFKEDSRSLLPSSPPDIACQASKPPLQIPNTECRSATSTLALPEIVYMAGVSPLAADLYTDSVHTKLEALFSTHSTFKCCGPIGLDYTRCNADISNRGRSQGSGGDGSSSGQEETENLSVEEAAQRALQKAIFWRQLRAAANAAERDAQRSAGEMGRELQGLCGRAERSSCRGVSLVLRPSWREDKMAYMAAERDLEEVLMDVCSRCTEEERDIKMDVRGETTKRGMQRGRLRVVLQGFAGRPQLVVALQRRSSFPTVDRFSSSFKMNNALPAGPLLCIDLFVSFSPLLIQRKNDHLREAAFEVPIDRLLLDSTLSFGAHQKFNDPCEPWKVLMVADAVAKVKRKPTKQVLEQSSVNAAFFYGFHYTPATSSHSADMSSELLSNDCNDSLKDSSNISGEMGDSKSFLGGVPGGGNIATSSGGCGEGGGDDGNGDNTSNCAISDCTIEAESDWACRACTYTNVALKLCCEMCGTTRFDEGGNAPVDKILHYDSSDSEGSDGERGEKECDHDNAEIEAFLAQRRKAEEKRKKKKLQQRGKQMRSQMQALELRDPFVLEDTTS